MSPGHQMLVFALAFGIAVVGTPAMRRAALRFDVVDRPSARKRHLEPVPLLGGLAIYGAVLGSIALYPDRRALVQLAGIAIGASWMSFWGLLDDRLGLAASVKLLAQLAAAAILIASGIRIALPGPEWADLALTVLWVVGITNAFNLLDNMDGLSSGVGAVAAGWFLLLAAMNGQFLVGGLAAGVLGACLGFLRYNFNPARIFMGDSGSLFLGFVMAALAIKLRFPTNVNWVTWMVPVLVLGVPIFDTTLVFVSRLRRGRNPLTTPGTDHLSHRLARLGWTRREVVLALYLVGCVLGGLALFISLASPGEAYALLAIVAAIAVAAIVRLEGIERAPAGAVATSPTADDPEPS
jgi:UDP-GlcNAc:undecaprenyl-phosphate GlcNAc-1-phosphate transferase